MSSKRGRIFVFLAFALLVAAGALLADGTVTAPQNVAPTTWGIASIIESAGLNGETAGVTVIVYYFDASGSMVKSDIIRLTNAEVVTYLTTINSPVAGESGSQIKRHRQRATKALIDLGKIANVTPES